MGYEQLLEAGGPFRFVHLLVRKKLVLVPLLLGVLAVTGYLLVTRLSGDRDKDYLLAILIFLGVGSAACWLLGILHALMAANRRWILLQYLLFPSAVVYVAAVSLSGRYADAEVARAVARRGRRVSRLHALPIIVLLALCLSWPLLFIAAVAEWIHPNPYNEVSRANSAVCDILEDGSPAEAVEELRELIDVIDAAGPIEQFERDYVLAHIALLRAFELVGDDAKAARMLERVFAVSESRASSKFESTDDVLLFLRDEELCRRSLDKTIAVLQAKSQKVVHIATDAAMFMVNEAGEVHGLSHRLGSYGDDLPVIERVETTDRYACALSKSGEVSCWQIPNLGYECEGPHCWGPESWGAPRAMVEGAKAVGIGAAHACAATTDGRVWCWGDSTLGSLGIGETDEPVHRRPVEVAGLPASKDVALGLFHSCALTIDGEVWCWGRNDLGQIGDGTREIRWAPLKVELPRTARQLVAGNWHTCALVTGGEVYCWGSLGLHFFPRVKDDSIAGAYKTHTNAHRGCGWKLADKPVLQTVAKGATEIAAGGNYSCLINERGKVACWGGGDFPADELSWIPYARRVLDVSIGDRFGCGVQWNGEGVCWGRGARRLSFDIRQMEIPVSVRTIEFPPRD